MILSSAGGASLVAWLRLGAPPGMLISSVGGLLELFDERSKRASRRAWPQSRAWSRWGEDGEYLRLTNALTPVTTAQTQKAADIPATLATSSPWSPLHRPKTQRTSLETCRREQTLPCECQVSWSGHQARNSWLCGLVLSPCERCFRCRLRTQCGPFAASMLADHQMTDRGVLSGLALLASAGNFGRFVTCRY
jgi:hypothetical protein